MKTLITLLFLFVVSLGHCQFISLDSINYLEINSFDSFTTQYEYNEENGLISEIKNYNWPGFNVRLVYLENDKYDSLIVGDQDLGLTYCFKYDSPEYTTTIHTEENNIETIYKLKEEENRITSVESWTIEDGNEKKNSEYKFIYDSENRLDSIRKLNLANTGPDIKITDFYYNPDGTYKYIDNIRPIVPQINSRDTFYYNLDGDSERVVKKNLNDIIQLELNYSDVSVYEGLDRHPFDFYDFMHNVIESKTNEIYYKKLSIKNHQFSTYKIGAKSYEMTWYFTFATNTKELPAQLISVYPNPTTDILNFDIDDIEKVEIYNVMVYQPLS